MAVVTDFGVATPAAIQRIQFGQSWPENCDENSFLEMISVTSDHRFSQSFGSVQIAHQLLVQSLIILKSASTLIQHVDRFQSSLFQFDSIQISFDLP